MQRDIQAARFARGEKLPPQSELGRRYGASRHAVRRALGALEDDGVISCWQGREATVVAEQITYRIGPQTRLASGLRAAGHRVEVVTLQSNTSRRLVPSVAKMLGVATGTHASFAEFMHIVDGVPTALGRHFFNSAKFPDILADAVGTEPSVPLAFARHGVDAYFRSATLVEGRMPTPSEALALDIPPAQSVLSLLGRNVDKHGIPIEVTEAIVRSDTVRLEIAGHQVRDLV